MSKLGNRLFNWYDSHSTFLPFKKQLAVIEKSSLNKSLSVMKKKVDEMSIGEMHEYAKINTKKELMEWIDNGAETEYTVHRNRMMLDEILLMPKSINTVEIASTETDLFDKTYDMPIFIAPMGRMGWISKYGETSFGIASQQMNIPLFVSEKSTYPIETIKKKSSADIIWMRYYDSGNDVQNFIKSIERIKKIKGSGFGITVDAQLSTKVKFRRLYNYATEDLKNRAIDMNKIKKIVSSSDLPVIIKGILNPLDAKEALESGVSAIIVSNHGGRNLDYSPSSIEMLPEIVKVVNGKIPVLFDSGVRYGTDVLKAISIGASGVLVGRPACWALIAGEVNGVKRMLYTLQDELKRAMILTGKKDLKSLKDMEKVHLLPSEINFL
ncbi:MAG: alpha-hydroxy-acid oxidizing protein [Candidatus Thermoplasmatota archaeon]|jgi:isopentenyl diphosphate isomerase/L-lactate dehydrogenase-like FMN-dependent dehydrogenase|nr:alpha-hydroxy-acid oxidizing protein [Candidatus Thermoplasmatota archaeon]MCL5963988.1 alpha-hydroxy-acid oxidizing protein [Candidatus Thermoplasmatota archaeon]